MPENSGSGSSGEDRVDTASSRAADGPRRVGVGHPNRPALGWTEIGIVLGSYVLLNVIVVAAVLLAGTTPSIFVAVVASAVTAFAAVTIAAAVRVRSFAALGLRAVSWRWIGLGIGAGVAVWLINRVVVLIYISVTGDTSNPQQELNNAAAGSVAGLVFMLALGAVLVPIGEELLFRGVIYGGLRRYGVTVATIASAAVFGLAHGISIVLVGAVILGVVAALLYERTRSIWPAVAVHGVNNGISFAIAALVLG